MQIVAFLSILVHVVLGSNWAQVSGPKEQNIALNNFPSAAHPLWQPRYGMTVINLLNESAFNDFGSVILAGGDVYDADYTLAHAIPNLLDYKWGSGYKNDIWKMSSSDWQVVPDQTGRKNGHRQKLPRVRSTVKWTMLSPGTLPPPRVTYDDWIICQDYFNSAKYQSKRSLAKCGQNGTISNDVMWTPRRHHASVYFKGNMWILGGRAREVLELSEEESVGGIISPRVKDVDSGLGSSTQLLTTQREASIVKSDVWRSKDGVHWTLVTPGCKAPQSLLIPEGNPREGKQGKSIFACQSDADCYGAEYCDTVKQTCVCGMWSSREQHAVAVHGDYMYVSGGYASYLYSQRSACGSHPCGDTDASAYRYYLSDVWRSKDGDVWEPVTQAAAFPGRGGHQMLAITDLANKTALWVLGGRGGDDLGLSNKLVYYNDVWTSSLADSYPLVWTLKSNHTGAKNSLTNMTDEVTGSYDMPWTPRTGHTVTLQPATASNGNIRALYLVGGLSANGTVLDDVWSWRLDDGNSGWIKDFTPSALYSTVYKSKFGSFNESPLVSEYITPDSDISLMQRYFVPSYPIDYPGRPLEKRKYLQSKEIEMMRSVGINTINDLAKADKYVILKLRGFDIPQVPLSQRLTVTSVCDFRALALALMKKCTLSDSMDRYYNEELMPWNVIPEFDGPAPVEDPVKWHGIDYSVAFASNDGKTKEQRTAEWDGCSYLDGFTEVGYGSPNVLNIGPVTQVPFIRDPILELENLGCKQSPGKRVHHSAIMYQERLFIFGGKSSDQKFYADAWYRDSNLPNAYIPLKPITRTSDPTFIFTADKPGCYFEYRIWAPADYKLVRGWTPVVRQTDVSWLDSRKYGPGTGLYSLYVRAIDPAGNRDVYYTEGRNVYTWIYVDPTPWDLILGGIGGCLGFLILAYLEYRRRRKKAAMERYALKRMRRKFKALQKDADDKGTDWRTLYNENKAENDDVKRKRALKRARLANQERLEKDASKRDKEKEAIKLKMQQKKEQLRRKRLNDGGTYGFGDRTDEDIEKASNVKKKKEKRER